MPHSALKEESNIVILYLLLELTNVLKVLQKPNAVVQTFLFISCVHDCTIVVTIVVDWQGQLLT